MRRKLNYVILNLADGMDTTSNYLALGFNKSTVATNIDFSVPDQFSKRTGLAKILSTTPFGSIGDYYVLGLYTYITSAGVEYLMCAGSDGKVYKMDALDGTWDSIATSKTTDTAYRYNFSTLASYALIVNGVDGPMSWNGTTLAVITGCPSDASLVTSFYGYAWMNSKTNKSYIYRSAYYDPTTWNTTNWYYPIDTSDGEEVTALLGGKKILYVWKSRSLHSISVVDSNTTSPTFKHYRLFETGCNAPKSVQQTPFGIMWYNKGKVYLWDESTYPVEISSEIRTDLLACNHAVEYKFNSCWNPDTNQYMLSVAYGSGQLTCNRVYVVTLGGKSPKWALYTLSINDFTKANISGNLSCFAAVSGETGYTYKLLSGLTDDGAAIAGTLKTKWFSPADFKLTTERAYLEEIVVTATADGAWPILVGYEVDMDPAPRTYQISLDPGASLIGTTYVIGVSPFGGGNAEIIDKHQYKGVSFRRIRLVFSNVNASQSFTIKEVKLAIRQEK